MPQVPDPILPRKRSSQTRQEGQNDTGNYQYGIGTSHWAAVSALITISLAFSAPEDPGRQRDPQNSQWQGS